jgi:S-DNA-T family DNA segregation ATPase FtsK/SpoIIIE
MPVRVQTRSLLALLADLSHTAAKDPDAGAVGGILLHTGRGEIGDEPGRTDLLAGASTDRFVAGHTYTACAGQLSGAPTLWALRDVKSVIAVFKAPAKADEMHAVDITRDGPLITIAEDPNLFDDGLKLSFAQMPVEDYPAAGVYRNLDRETADRVENQGGRLVESLPRTDFAPSKLDAFAKVAARRGCPLQLYRTHQAEAILVQIGGTYRGVMTPSRYEPDGDERRPDAEVHVPDLDALETQQKPAQPEPPAASGRPGLFLVEDES